MAIVTGGGIGAATGALRLVGQDPGYEEARRWAGHALGDGRDAYSFSKEAIIVCRLRTNERPS
ncbi:MAG: hypothetical protein QM661_01860 [Solimonas sp.]